MKKSEIKDPNAVRDYLNNEVKKGEHKLIAKCAECTAHYVGMVIRGERNSKKVLRIALELVNNRELFIEKMKKKYQKA